MKKLIFSGSLLIMAWCLIMAGPARAEEVIAKGKAVYDAKCAMCHGKDAKGNAGMMKALGVPMEKLDLTDQGTQETADEKLSSIILKGDGKMKAVAGVSAEQANSVTAYLKSLVSKKSDKATQAAPAAAPVAAVSESADPKLIETYKLKCASCHGVNGKGNAALGKAMKLELEELDLTDKETLDKSNSDLDKITRDGHGKMPAYKGKLSEAEIAALTQYIRQLAEAK